MHVLLCSPQPDDYLSVRDALDRAEAGARVAWVDSYEDARRELASGMHDVGLVDPALVRGRLPSLVGECALLGVDTPILAFLGEPEPVLETSFLRSGGAGIVRRGDTRKPLRFARALSRAVLRSAARHPILTPRRWLFIHTIGECVDQIESVLARAEASAREAAVIAVALEPPPEDASRVALVEGLLPSMIVERLRSHLDRDDVLLRFGRRKWLVILEGGLDASLTEARARELGEALGRPFHVPGRTLSLVPNVTYAVHPEDADNASDLFDAVRCTLFRPVYGEPLKVRRLSHETSMALRSRGAEALARALEEGLLELVFQPEVELRDGHMVSAEALLRFRSEEFGDLRPGELLETAESAGLSGALDALVLREAAATARRFLDKGSPVRISVNVTLASVLDGSVVEAVDAALESTRLPPRFLAIEVAGVGRVGGGSIERATLAALRERGVELVLDDFGTGYAALACLKGFPTDAIKIDRAFVKGLPLVPEDAAIATAIVALGRSLGLTVVAEGVETAAAEAFLADIRCDRAQGHGIAPPLSEEELFAFRHHLPPILEPECR